METITPSSSKIFATLFKADLIVQWRNRRASILSMIVPVLILVSWQSLVKTLGGPFVLASCITIGVASVGLMGFANTIATSRAKGIFQRLRVTPASTTQIMVSRIAVQVLQMAVMAIVVFIVGYFLDHIVLSLGGYLLALLASMLCGAIFLALGLALVGLIASPETVNAVTRFVYIGVIVIGLIGELGVLGTLVKQIVLWSPYGTVKVVLLASMLPSTWNTNATIALVVTALYMVVFAFFGIKWFKWSSNN